ncbi:hypothetical protein RB595_001045 [Gaeumannomyces hyphopodioides]
MASGGQQINLDSLSAQQLSSVKKQLDEEVEHLTSSFTQLHAAQGKFRECLRIVKEQAASSESKRDVLVPLTNSLYVQGKLSDPDRVLVDVGTGFYIEKNAKSATEFYEAKTKELGTNIQGLEAIIQGKTNNLRVVEEGTMPSHSSPVDLVVSHRGPSYVCLPLTNTNLTPTCSSPAPKARDSCNTIGIAPIHSRKNPAYAVAQYEVKPGTLRPSPARKQRTVQTTAVHKFNHCPTLARNPLPSHVCHSGLDSPVTLIISLSHSSP